MVEECQGYGVVGCGGCVFDLLVCWYGVWIAGLGEVYWEVEDVDAEMYERAVYIYIRFVYQAKGVFTCMA